MSELNTKNALFSVLTVVVKDLKAQRGSGNEEVQLNIYFYYLPVAVLSVLAESRTGIFQKSRDKGRVRIPQSLRSRQLNGTTRLSSAPTISSFNMTPEDPVTSRCQRISLFVCFLNNSNCK